MDCKTIGHDKGSIIVGCGSNPCRCPEIDAEMERVFGESRAESMAEIEAMLNEPIPAGYVPSGDEWWD